MSCSFIWTITELPSLFRPLKMSASVLHGLLSSGLSIRLILRLILHKNVAGYVVLAHASPAARQSLNINPWAYICQWYCCRRRRQTWTCYRHNFVKVLGNIRSKNIVSTLKQFYSELKHNLAISVSVLSGDNFSHYGWSVFMWFCQSCC